MKGIVKYAGGTLGGMSVGIESRRSDQLSTSQGADDAPVHFVYHVPKCAGRTIDRHLLQVLPSPAYHRMKKRRGLGRFATRYDPRDLPHPRRTNVVGGHYLGISVDPLFQGRQIKRSLLLRDPVSQFVSYYNFRMVRYISAGMRPYGVDLAYGATQRNFITHYILSNFLELSWSRIAGFSDQDKYDLVNAFLADFWFVGDYQLCDELIGSLGDRLGFPPSATAHNTLAELSRVAGWTPLTLDQLPRDAVMGIQAENAIDQRLWETWREVRHDTSAVQPRPLEARASSFISSEASRFVNQIMRRMQRRWGVFDAPVPVMHGDTATPA